MTRNDLIALHEAVKDAGVNALALFAKEYSRIAFDGVIKVKNQAIQTPSTYLLLHSKEWQELNDTINLLNRIGERLDSLVNGVRIDAS